MKPLDRWLVFLVSAFFAAVGCSSNDTEKPDETDAVLKIYTTFYPTAYFARRIGGDRVDVVCPLPDDADPVFWTPPREVLGEMQQADMIVINGAGFEKWISKISLPYSKVVDTSNSLNEELLRYEGAVTHSHGPEGEHSHEGIDGHIWIDPLHAKKQAEAIHRRLAKLQPESAEHFQTNFDALVADLDTLDQALSKLSDQLKKEHLLASHPAYNYLIRRYGGKLTNVLLDGQEMPDDQTLDQLQTAVEKQRAHIILWEQTPRKAIEARLKEQLGLDSIVFQPCEHPPTTAERGDDYLTIMRRNIEALKAEL